MDCGQYGRAGVKWLAWGWEETCCCWHTHKHVSKPITQSHNNMAVLRINPIQLFLIYTPSHANALVCITIYHNCCNSVICSRLCWGPRGIPSSIPGHPGPQAEQPCCWRLHNKLHKRQSTLSASLLINYWQLDRAKEFMWSSALCVTWLLLYSTSPLNGLREVTVTRQTQQYDRQPRFAYSNSYSRVICTDHLTCFTCGLLQKENICINQNTAGGK